MPRAGSEWTTITISKKVYENIKQAMVESNEEAGYRKFRSISHFVEHAVMNYEEGSDIEGGWRKHYSDKVYTEKEWKEKMKERARDRAKPKP